MQDTRRYLLIVADLNSVRTEMSKGPQDSHGTVAGKNHWRIETAWRREGRRMLEEWKTADGDSQWGHWTVAAAVVAAAAVGRRNVSVGTDGAAGGGNGVAAAVYAAAVVDAVVVVVVVVCVHVYVIGPFC